VVNQITASVALLSENNIVVAIKLLASMLTSLTEIIPVMPQCCSVLMYIAVLSDVFDAMSAVHHLIHFCCSKY